MTDGKPAFTGNLDIGRIIEENPSLLPAVCRFSDSLGYGHSSVRDFCRKNGTDLDSFLAIINLVAGRHRGAARVEIPEVIRYVRRSCLDISECMLPAVKKYIIEGLKEAEITPAAFDVLKKFEAFARNTGRSFLLIETGLLRPAELLLSGTHGIDVTGLDVGEYISSVTEGFSEFQETALTEGGLPGNAGTYMAVSRFNLCRSDFLSLSRIMTKILIPGIKAVTERRRETSGGSTSRPWRINQRSEEDILSGREKEITSGIAQGLSTREIAEALGLSPHTVATYRKKIIAKLNMHNTAELTAYAIRNHLVDLP